MALNGLNCAYVPLRNYSLTHSLTVTMVGRCLRRRSQVQPRSSCRGASPIRPVHPLQPCTRHINPVRKGASIVTLP